MKTMLALLLAIFSLHASAQTYVDTITVYRFDRTSIFAGCNVIQHSDVRIGAWCTEEFTVLGARPSLLPPNAPPAEVVVLSFDGTFGFFDESGDCGVISRYESLPGAFGYEVQCGDFLMHNGFEGDGNE